MHSSWKSRVGGPWVFLANSFEGGTWGCEKIREGLCFIAFLCGSFSKIFIGGTWGAPPPPSPPCVHLCLRPNNNWGVYNFRTCSRFICTTCYKFSTLNRIIFLFVILFTRRLCHLPRSAFPVGWRSSNCQPDFTTRSCSPQTGRSSGSEATATVSSDR